MKKIFTFVPQFSVQIFTIIGFHLDKVNEQRKYPGTTV